MSFSTEIIKVLDDLATRFGIAIDWTADNITPVVADVVERYIKFEIFKTSIWTIFAILLVVIYIFWMFKTFKYFKKIVDDNPYDKDIWGLFVVQVVIFAFPLYLFSNSLLGLAEWIIIPEIPLMEEIFRLINK